MKIIMDVNMPLQKGGQNTYKARGFVEHSKSNRPDWSLEWKD